MRAIHVLGYVLLIAGVSISCTPQPTEVPRTGAVPDWAADAVFYQIFPERFRNGDPSNDPTRASIEFAERAPGAWTVSSWTADWYSRADWETEMGDGFYDSVFHRRYGGDLKGVMDQLDYLADLGINAIYFNPVFYARSLHKYDGSSFHHIDPYFGPDPEGDLALIAQETSDPSTWKWTAADQLFLQLLAEAHQRNIRVVIDGVWNHTGRTFFAFDDLRKRQQDSPYKDWYIVTQFDDAATAEDEFDYEGWWGYKALPVFADTPDGTDLHPGPKAYIMDATARWMDPNGDGDPSDGIDGWRLDVANEVPLRFWIDWNAHVRQLNPEAYTVSEIWEDAVNFLVEGGFSATMNYHAFAMPIKGFLIDEQLSASGFTQLLNERRIVYSTVRQQALQNLLDSHDTPRLASMIVNREQPYSESHIFDYDRQAGPRDVSTYDVRKPTDEEWQIQRLIGLFQMTYVGAPMLYYGTEAGMWGADDPDDRMPMVWPDLTYVDQVADPLNRSRTPDPVAFDEALFGFYKQAIALRHNHAVLRSGDLRWLHSNDANQTVAFIREDGANRLVIALNRSTEPQTVSLPWGEVGGQVQFAPVLVSSDTDVRLIDGTALTVELPPLTGVVLRPVSGDA